MSARLFHHVAHLLLSVMLVTFLSPSFAAGMLSSHENLEHRNVQNIVSSDDWHGDAEATDHAHAVATHSAHEHEEAHSVIGHLFSHMGTATSGTLAVLMAPALQSRLSYLKPHSYFTALDPPFRPPRPHYAVA